MKILQDCISKLMTKRKCTIFKLKDLISMVKQPIKTNLSYTELHSLLNSSADQFGVTAYANGVTLTK